MCIFSFLFSLSRCWRQYLREEKGNMIMLVSVGIFALIGAMGSAIDMGRAQMVHAHLSSALDAAGLAAGAVVNTSDINAEASNYFNVNFPEGFLGAHVHDLTAVLNTDKTIITLTAKADVNTAFMKLFGINTLTVSATSEVTRVSKGLELVLVMDNTGSMTDPAGSNLTKLQAAKNAATDLVNILFGSKSSVDNLWVGLVPFSQAVNIGTSHTSWVTTDSFNWGPTSWAGCVDARETSSRDVTDDPPSVAKFPRYYWKCDTNDAWYGSNSGGHNNCNITTSPSFGYRPSLGISIGPNKSCPTAVTPMTSDKTTILNAITAMQAVGNTHIVLGAGWGWRMLSPRWRNLWGGEMDAKSLPLDYNTPLMNKVVILMTDGDNTIDNVTRGAYWYLSDNKLGTTNSTQAITELNNRMTSVCNSMKNNNILVYTIALGTDISTTAKTLLKGCASKPEFYFASPTSTDLQTAFHTIGDSLANLRISK